MLMRAPLLSGQEQQDQWCARKPAPRNREEGGREGGREEIGKEGERQRGREGGERCLGTGQEQHGVGTVGCSFLWTDLAFSPSDWDHHIALDEPQGGGWLGALTLESTEWGTRSWQCQV